MKRFINKQILFIAVVAIVAMVGFFQVFHEDAYAVMACCVCLCDCQNRTNESLQCKTGPAVPACQWSHACYGTMTTCGDWCGS